MAEVDMRHSIDVETGGPPNTVTVTQEEVDEIERQDAGFVTCGDFDHCAFYPSCRCGTGEDWPPRD